MTPDRSGATGSPVESTSGPLRILVVAPTSFFGDRGCHVRIYEEVRALAAIGVQSSVVTYPTGRDLPDVRTVRARPIPGVSGGPLGFSPGRPVLDAALWWAANREVGRFHPHLLHAHLHEGIAIGVALRSWHRLPLVADLQGSLSGELVDQGVLGDGGFMARATEAVERWLVRRPSQTLTSSSQGISLLTAQGVAPRDVTLLPDGVDLDAFRPGPPDPGLVDTLGLAGKRVVVFLGVLTNYQGVDLLLDVGEVLAQTCPDVHLLVLGYPNEERYRAEARARGLDYVMTFPGRVLYDQASRWLCLGEVAVSPKRSLTEANGKLLNYMACGLPVVASDTPVNRELLGEAGVYAPVGAAKVFAEQIAALLADRERARGLGAALRLRAAAEFSWPALAKRIEQVYRELLKESTGHAESR